MACSIFHIPPDFPESLLAKIGAHWKLDSSMTVLRKVTNTVFTVTKNGHEYILRISPNWHRTQEQLADEIALLTYLDEQGIPVATPLPTTSNVFIETFPYQKHVYHTMLFTKVPGEKLDLTTNITPHYARLIGTAIAYLHRASKHYSQSHWHRFTPQSMHPVAHKIIPSNDHLFWNEYTEFQEWFQSLEQTDNVFDVIQ